MPVDLHTNRHRGYGFVVLQDSRDVADAVAKMMGQEIHGRPIKVEQKDGRAAA